MNDTAIRIRIIPNSNKYEDQQAKKMVRYAIDEYLAANKSAFKRLIQLVNLLCKISVKLKIQSHMS